LKFERARFWRSKRIGSRPVGHVARNSPNNKPLVLS
jgi:hypothetical protein